MFINYFSYVFLSIYFQLQCFSHLTKTDRVVRAKMSNVCLNKRLYWTSEYLLLFLLVRDNRKYFVYLQFRLDALRHHIEQQLRMALKHRFAIGKAKNDIVSLIRFPIFSFFFLTNQTKLLILMCKHLDLWYLDIIQKQSNICFIAPPPHTTMNISFF